MDPIWNETAEALLAASRPYLEALLQGTPSGLPVMPSSHPEVTGLFFTIYDREGELRGSGGTSHAAGPLAETLAEAIRQAAIDDPRFPPLPAEELPACRLALTLLGGGERITGPEPVEFGVTALFVRRGLLSGITLPEVALGREWNGKVFLAYACRKAGLHALAWKKADTEVTAFPTVRAAEPDAAEGK